jgi:hypothetical protein
MICARTADGDATVLHDRLPQSANWTWCIARPTWFNRSPGGKSNDMQHLEIFRMLLVLWMPLRSLPRGHILTRRTDITRAADLSIEPISIDRSIFATALHA